MFVRIGTLMSSSKATGEGGSSSNASVMLANYTDGLAFDFTDMSCVIKDTTTPANNFSGDANDKLSGSTLTASTNGVEFTTALGDVSMLLSAAPWSATAGTVFAKFTGKSAASASHLLSLTNDTFQEWVALRGLGTNPEFLVFDSGNFQTLDAGTWVTSGTNKLAGAWSAGSGAVSYNGAAAVTNASVGTPAATTLYIGRSYNASERYEGFIQQIMYLPQRLSNVALAALTAA